MRAVAIPAFFLFAALAGLAVVPGAAAAPPAEPCNGTWATTQEVGPLTVFASPPCYQVDIEAMSCPLAGSWKTLANAQSVTVRAYTCDQPGPAAEASAVLIPPVCIWREVAQGPVKVGADMCRESHETYPSCSSAQRLHYYEQVGPVYAQADVCFPHSPPPTLAAAALDLPNPCGPTALCQGPECPAESVETTIDHRNSVEVSRDCSVEVVTGEGQICVGAWSAHDTHEVGPVTWERYYCNFPGGNPIELAIASNNPGPCGAASPQQRCPAPVPLCSGISDDLFASASGPVGAHVDVWPSCHVDVYVKADVMDCLWGEGYNRGPTVGPVTVWTWGCKPFDPTTSAAADPFPTCVTTPCGPSLPNPGCTLQDNTPAPLLHPLWGYDNDCVMEVSTACTGGASGSTDVRAAFLDVSIAKCSGPAWS